MTLQPFGLHPTPFGGDSLPAAGDVLKRLALAMARDFQGIEGNAPRAMALHSPHILDRLSSIWSTAAATDYLDALMVSDRVDRMGFSPGVMADVFFLDQLHNFLYPSMDMLRPRVEEILHRSTAPRNLRELVERYSQYGITPPVHSSDPLAESPLRPRGWGEVGSAQELRANLVEPGALQRRRRIGEILVDEGLIAVEKLEQALDLQANAVDGRRPVGAILKEMRLIEEEDVIKALCVQTKHLLVDLDAIPMTDEAVQAFSKDVARDFSVIPLLRLDRTLVVVVEEPLLRRSMQLVAVLEQMTGLNIRVAWAPPAAISRRLANYAPGRIEKRM